MTLRMRCKKAMLEESYDNKNMQTSTFWHIIRYKIGWLAIVFFTVIPMAWTIRLLLVQDLPFERYTLMSTFGLMEGIAGLMLYAISLVLSARLKFMERYFGGLNRMYIAHHLTGGVALIFLCLHPIVLAARNIEPISREGFRLAAEFLWFHPFSFERPISQGMALNFGLIALLGTVILLILTFFVRLRYQLWLLTHKFLGVAFFFAALHVVFIQGLVSNDQFLRWYLLAWCGLGLVAFIYKTIAGRILIRQYTYKVTDITKPVHDVISFSMDPVGQRMDFQPGQFVFIRFKKNKDSVVSTESHPFSVASGPDEKTLKLSVRALGDYTKDLLSLKPGAIAEIEGAYGKFSYKNYANPNQVWIAGGIGIVPFLSMAQSVKKEKDLHIDLYYCVKKKCELIDEKQLSSMPNLSNIDFKFIPYAEDTHGFLTADIIKQKSGNLSEKEFYICGPPAMMKDLRTQLKTQGVPSYKIHSEEFSMS